MWNCISSRQIFYFIFDCYKLLFLILIRGWESSLLSCSTLGLKWTYLLKNTQSKNSKLPLITFIWTPQHPCVSQVTTPACKLDFLMQKQRCFQCQIRFLTQIFGWITFSFSFSFWVIPICNMVGKIKSVLKKRPWIVVGMPRGRWPGL